MEIYNAKSLAAIKAERAAEIREAVETGSVDIYEAVAGLYEEVILLAERLNKIEGGGK